MPIRRRETAPGSEACLIHTSRKRCPRQQLAREHRDTADQELKAPASSARHSRAPSLQDSHISEGLHWQTVPSDVDVEGWCETSQLRDSRASSRESRSRGRHVNRLRRSQLKRTLPDDLWFLGTGPENDEALGLAPPVSAFPVFWSSFASHVLDELLALCERCRSPSQESIDRRAAFASTSGDRSRQCCGTRPWIRRMGPYRIRPCRRIARCGYRLQTHRTAKTCYLSGTWITALASSGFSRGSTAVDRRRLAAEG